MRYLTQQTLNRRAIFDQRLYVDMTSSVVMNTTNNMLVPKGSTALRPVSPVEGMMRYNTTTHQMEVYQGSSAAWKAIRYKEATQITQQNLGAGDSTTVYFGPLSSAYNTSSAGSISAYPNGSSSDISSYGAQNIIVLVENVMQISGTNYTVVQNPTISAETYTGSLSVAASSGSSILYFNTSLNVTTASWTSNVATVTVSNTTSSQPGFAIGATITVADIRSTGQTTSAFNGVFTVTGSTATTVTYALTTNPGTYQNGGSVTASGSTPAIFPAVSLTGAVVSGSNIYSGALVTGSAITDPNTGALTSISMNHAPTGSIAVNTIAITITENARTISDNSYWLFFSSPVPYGKTVTALFGFDQ